MCWTAFPRLEETLRSALVSPEEKEQIARPRVRQPRVDSRSLNFLKVLSTARPAGAAAADRADPEEAARRAQRADGRRSPRGGASWTMRCEAKFEQRLQRTLGTRTGAARESIDPSLIAGIWVRVGDRVFDGSIRTQFEHARRAMIDRATERIETHRNDLCQIDRS